MATFAYLTSFQAAGNAINRAANDFVYIGQDASIASTGGIGLNGVSGHRVTVEGDLFGNSAGVYFSSNVGSNSGFVAEGGSVTSAVYGYYDNGNNGSLLNAGTIFGIVYGVLEIGTNARVHNTGLIGSDTIGLYLGASTGATRVVNSGDILSGDVAILTSSADDAIYNTGLVAGAINLSNGNDLLDSRGGTLQGVVNLGSGNDTAYGGDGADSINGGADLDRLRGKLGDDRLDGGLGNDTMTGGQGEDEFQFSTALGIGNIDTITDFVHKEDTILLDDAIFTALGPDIQKNEFLVTLHGHSATKASHHIIYDNSKGTLWYDIDGKGGTAAIKFAQLGSSSDHPTNLNYHDFAIV